MPENPIIQEGGSGRRMGSVGRIITFRDGGNDFWVPASERLTAQKFISKNGVYLASDEELFAYSKLTVNVYGGAPGMTVPTTPTGPYGVETPTGETPAEIPAIPGGPGSSITGIDPTDGQKYTATVMPDGTIKMVRGPASIRVFTPPAKLEYVEGEKIDYNGLVIELLDAKGEVFTDSNYPNGRITWTAVRWNKIQDKPYLNLNVETTMETAEDGGRGHTSYPDVYFTEVSEGEYYFFDGPYNDGFGAYYDHVRFTVPAGRACVNPLTNDPSDGYLILVNPEDGGRPTVTECYRTRYTPDGTRFDWTVNRASWTSTRHVMGGKAYYYSYLWPSFSISSLPDWPSSTGLTRFSDGGLWVDAFYGEGAGTGTSVPVGWNSPYDGMPLQTEFEITVSKSGDNEGGGGESGGGGGGHGF